MLTPEYASLFERIDAAGTTLLESRGTAAAALWSIDVFIADRSTLFCDRDDAEKLDKFGHHLALRRDERGRAGLWIMGGDEPLAAHRAPATLQIAAIKRVAHFLESVTRDLESIATDTPTMVALSKKALQALAARSTSVAEARA